MKARTQFEVVIFIRPRNITAGRPTLKDCAATGYAHATFCPKFIMAFCSEGRHEYTSRLEVRSLTHS